MTDSTFSLSDIYTFSQARRFNSNTILLNIYRLPLWILPVTICDPCTYWGGKKKIKCFVQGIMLSVSFLLITKIIPIIHVTESHTVLLPASPKFTVVYVMTRCTISVFSKHHVRMAPEPIASLNFWTWVKGSGGLLTFLLWGLHTYTLSEQEASLQVSCSS